MSAIERLAAICARFVNDESGGTAIEYALMLAMIAMASFVAITTLGTGVVNIYSNLVTTTVNATS